MWPFSFNTCVINFHKIGYDIDISCDLKKSSAMNIYFSSAIKKSINLKIMFYKCHNFYKIMFYKLFLYKFNQELSGNYFCIARHLSILNN